MKNLLYLALLGIIFTSCQKEEFEIERNYQFEMTGRTTQDINGYYHVKINNNLFSGLTFFGDVMYFGIHLIH